MSTLNRLNDLSPNANGNIEMTLTYRQLTPATLPSYSVETWCAFMTFWPNAVNLTETKPLMEYWPTLDKVSWNQFLSHCWNGKATAPAPLVTSLGQHEKSIESSTTFRSVHLKRPRQWWRPQDISDDGTCIWSRILAEYLHLCFTMNRRRFRDAVSSSRGTGLEQYLRW